MLSPIDPVVIDPVVLPILHPSYQNIWIARPGYDAEEYRAALAERLDSLIG